ncbi:uncharacterized protein LOC131259539 isoform X1 [Anopheles coustani]|uniref:uncharacterized protein LOC131259539 isoform X1 n=1 Tax=Anopheles coustani TaxID=139045 RepID=UPI00265AF154|nr:uncharacterized protein LOC131259539 isoform X1 [Anopheles coustani]
MMDRNSLSGTLVSSFCRICTTNNDVDWSIYETLNEDEGTTNLHMMLVKLYPTVFNESQVLCDEALKWPTKICKECKAKVIESYKFYERCTKSARSLRTIASKEQPTTDTLQEEKDDHPAVIKMEFIECEEPIVPKEECDSDDHSSTYKRFYRSSPTEDVFSDTEDSRPAPTSIQSSSSSANKMEQIQSTKQNANLKASFTGTFLSGGENSKLKQSDKSGKYKTTIVYNLEKEMTISAQNMKSETGNILRTYRQSGIVPHTGEHRKIKMPPATIDRLRSLIGEDCTISMQAVAKKMQQYHGIKVSVKSISRYFDGFHYSFKKVHVPQIVNAVQSDNNLTHKEYAIKLSSLRDCGTEIIFFHDVDFILNTRTGERGQVVRPARSRHISILCAISSAGVVQYLASQRAFDFPKVNTFIHELKKKLISKPDQRTVVIIDPEHFHQHEEIKQLVIEEKIQLLYLPPHSPCLNPLESMSCRWKDFTNRTNPPNVQQVVEAIDKIPNLITPKDCEKEFGLMWSNLSKYLVEDDINELP